MGNLCHLPKLESVTDSGPDSTTGLTRQEIEHIQDLWNAITGQVSFKENSTLFFLKLFEEYPSIQEFFPEFAQKDLLSLGKSNSLRTHGIGVFSEISSYVDSVDDSQTLVALIHKRALSHYSRGVTSSDMEKLKLVFLAFLQEKAGPKKATAEAMAAWDKFLSFHNVVYDEKCREMRETEKEETNFTKRPRKPSTII